MKIATQFSLEIGKYFMASTDTFDVCARSRAAIPGRQLENMEPGCRARILRRRTSAQHTLSGENAQHTFDVCAGSRAAIPGRQLEIGQSPEPVIRPAFRWQFLQLPQDTTVAEEKSPERTFSSASWSEKLNTTIGRELSLHIEKAVESMTSSFFSRASA